MHIRHMTEEDLPVILRMAAKEGWISDLTELQIFIELNPFGCFVYVEDKKVVGSIMTFRHSRSAWIGNFIVSKEYRGKGIGKRLLKRAIEYLDRAGGEQIYLNAAYEASKLYEESGFRKIIAVNRWQGKVDESISNMQSLRETIFDTLSYVKLDAFLWRDERFLLISQLSSLRHCRSYFKPPGFLMFGNAGDVITLGPWEVKESNEAVAEKLFISALTNLKSDSRILLDIPAINKKAQRIVQRHNFKIIGSTIFMCRGRLPKIYFDQIFSFATMGSMG